MAGRPTSAIVVGGGIAGLASAAALTRAGWPTTVLEQAPEFGEVGAGLGVTVNGMAVMDALGVGDNARAAGHQVKTAGFQDSHGRWILRIPEGKEDPDTAVLAIHRQRLHAAVLSAAHRARLVTDAMVTSVDTGAAGGDPATVTWRDKSGEHTDSADLVVAADGVRSVVRGQLFPQARLKYGGSTSWRAIIEDTDRIDDRLIAFWGWGAEFGALRVSATEVYWYGYFRAPAGTTFDDELAAARRHFSGWPARVTDVIDGTRSEQLMRHDVYHLPGGLPSYNRGRVVLVGDAAHAALPTMGQGAASALEDGICVGRLVAEPVSAGSTMHDALTAFDRARRPRCQRTVRRSAMVARLGADVTGRVQQQVRNGLLRLVPAGLVTRAALPLVRWRPPAAP